MAARALVRDYLIWCAVDLTQRAYVPSPALEQLNDRTVTLYVAGNFGTTTRTSITFQALATT